MPEDYIYTSAGELAGLRKELRELGEAAAGHVGYVGALIRHYEQPRARLSKKQFLAELKEQEKRLRAAVFLDRNSPRTGATAPVPPTENR